MTVQTSYSRDHAAGYPGQIANQNSAQIRSLVASADIEPGKACTPDGITGGSIRIPSASDTFEGVAVRTLDIEADANGVIKYVAGNDVNLFTAGEIFVTIRDTVVIDDPVCFIHTGGNEGDFRNDVDGGNADLIVGARFLDAGVTGEIVRIRIPAPVA